MNKNEIAQAVVEIPKLKGVFTIFKDEKSNFYAISPKREENNGKKEYALSLLNGAFLEVLENDTFYNSNYEFTGGMVDKDDVNLATAAKREMLEELLECFDSVIESTFIVNVFNSFEYLNFETIQDFLVLQTILRDGEEIIRGIFEITAFLAILNDEQVNYLLANDVIKKISLVEDSGDFRPYQRAIIKKNLARI